MEDLIQKNNNDFWGMSEQNFIVLMHLSHFSYFIVPGLGVIMPIIMWATCKDRSTLVDIHGKNILNWMLSLVVYSMIIFVVCFTIIFAFPAIFFGFMLLVLGFVFPIIGAIKASNKEIYNYPLSISFLK